MEISLNPSSNAKFHKEMLNYQKNLPRFPDGRIDYSNSPKAPVVSCFVEFDGKILLLKRSINVRFYPGKWGVITGFIDRSDSNIIEIAIDELKEELGVSEKDINELYVGKAYELNDKSIENKTWIIYPVLVRMKRKPPISLDWENDEFAWIEPSDLGMYKTLPGLKKSFSKIEKHI